MSIIASKVSCECHIAIDISESLSIMPILRTGRRRTKQDLSYNGPARQGPVRHISIAQLNLERVHEQNRLNVQKRDGVKAPEPAPGAAAKGKPRLLLMGQRRFEDPICDLSIYH